MQPLAPMHPAPSRCRRSLPAATPPSTRTSIIYAFFCFLLSPFRFFLESVRAGLTGANANDLFNRGDENLAVADLARACRALDRFDRLVDDIVRHRCFNLHFRQK